MEVLDSIFWNFAFQTTDHTEDSFGIASNVAFALFE